MKALKSTAAELVKFLLFWILVFDFSRLLFSIHNWDKLADLSMGEWLLAFLFSIRLDLATAAGLSAIPMVFVLARFITGKKTAQKLLNLIIGLELLVVACIYSGEMNAYTEWNHKLTTRVFMHLSNPDEVFRTADLGMIIWFGIYTVLIVAFGWKLRTKLFPSEFENTTRKLKIRIPIALSFFVL
jgi:glucan phosphoethanolaminetransferase (alkaline phosphatase superfamily)